MDRTPERTDHFIERLTRAGIVRHHRIAGIDGARLPHRLMDLSPADPIHGANLDTASPGMLGCRLSFAAALGVAIAARAETFLYFEDDAVIPERFAHWFETMYERIPPDWDVVNMGPWELEPRISESGDGIVRL